MKSLSIWIREEWLINFDVNYTVGTILQHTALEGAGSMAANHYSAYWEMGNCKISQ